MIARYIWTVLLILSGTMPLMSQSFTIGMKYGIGNNHYQRQSDDVETTDYRFNKGALVMEFSPFFSKLHIGTGVEFQTDDLGDILSFPLTARLAFGKKVLPFVEGGGYYNYVLNDIEDSFIMTNEAGAKAGCGLIFNLGKRWRFDAGYYRRFGFTAGLEEEIILPLDQIQTEYYKLREGSFEFSMKIRF